MTTEDSSEAAISSASDARAPRRSRGFFGPAVLGRVDLEAPGIKISFPASSRSVVLIVTSIASAFVMAVALIFVAARVENVEAAASWLDGDDKPAAARAAPTVTIFDGLADERVMAPAPARRKSDPVRTDD